MTAVEQTIRRTMMVALAAGVVILAVVILAGVSDVKGFYSSYLVGWLLWTNVALGGLGMTMIHTLVGGSWGKIVRRMFEAAMMTIPLMFILSIPLWFGLYELFPWNRPEVLTHNPAMQRRAVYLNPQWFAIRGIFFFLCWTVLALLMRHWSLSLDKGDDLKKQKRMRIVSAAGFILFALTVSFASIDWIISREPHWHSTIIGFIVLAGQGLSVVALSAFILCLAANTAQLKEKITPQAMNDLGNVLMTTVILFSYVAFVQFLILWSGNTEHKSIWYIPRTTGGWQWLGLVLIVFHFFVPFLLLLVRMNKRKRWRLAAIAFLLLLMRWVDMVWMIAPSGTEEHPELHISLLSIAAPVGIGGIWLAVFLFLWRRHPWLPQYELADWYESHESTGEPRADSV
jgi:hypothetical protein